jgi:hypothetical protein
MVTGLTLRVALGIDLACVAVGALAGTLAAGSHLPSDACAPVGQSAPADDASSTSAAAPSFASPGCPYTGGLCIEYYEGAFGPTLRVEVSTRILTGIFVEPFMLIAQ